MAEANIEIRSLDYLKELSEEHEGDPACLCAAWAVEEIERLRAVVASLPGTDNGVTIRPGMKVWWTGVNGGACCGLIDGIEWGLLGWQVIVNDLPLEWPYYSSREALEAEK